MNALTLYTLTYLLSQALGVYAIYKLIKSFFGDSIVTNTIEILSYVGYYILTASVYLIINIPLVNLVVNIIAVFLLTFLYSSPITIKLLAAILNYVFMFGTEMIVVTLTGYINFPITERNNYHSVFGIVMVNVLFYAVSMAVNGFKGIKRGNVLPSAYWISLFLIPISSLVVLVFTFQSEGLSIYQIAFSIVAVLIINFTAFFLFDRMAKLCQEKQDKELIEQ